MPMTMMWDELTPVQKIGNIFVKRDDMFEFAGMKGGKVRTCHYIISNSKSEGVITAGAKDSPQVNIVANVAKSLGKKCRVHVPANKEDSIQVKNARKAGAEIVYERPGYNSVIVSRANKDAKESGWTIVPFGMECSEAVEMTRRQAMNLPFGEFKRIVIPVGSGMSLAGLLHGLAGLNKNIPILGIVVGADPNKRLDRFAPHDWRFNINLELRPSGYPYDKRVTSTLVDFDNNDFIDLDPIYEAKCRRFLEDGDLLWIVGRREE